MINKQRGYSVLTIPGILVALSIVGIIAIYSLQEDVEENSNTLQINIQSEMTRLIKAHHACYDVERRWCTLAELQAAYITEDGAGIMGGGILQALNVNGDDLDISFNAGTVNMARQLRSKFPSTAVVGTRLTTTIEPPTASHMFQSNIQRYDDDEGFDRNVFEQDVDINNRILDNVSDFDGNAGAFTNLTAQNYNVDNISVTDALNLGAVSLLFNLNSMTLDATTINVNNGSLSGNIIEITDTLGGFDNADVDTLQFAALTSDAFTLDNAAGSIINYTTGNIQSISTQNLIADTFTGTTAILTDTNTIDAQGNVSAINGVTNTIQTDIADGNDATITDVDSTQIQAGLTTFGSVTSNTLDVNLLTSANTLTTSNLLVTGNTSGNSFISTTDFFTGVSSVNTNRTIAESVQNDADNNRINLTANATDLSALSPRISTNETEIANNLTNAANNVTDIASNRALIVQNTANLSTNTAGISNNTLLSTTNELGTNNNRIRLIANQAAIATNQSAIGNNVVGINTLEVDVNNNQSSSNSNTTLIANNVSDTQNNLILLAANTADILNNDGDISSNTSEISTNSIDILNNGSAITTNQTLASLNAASISGNQADIGVNQANIDTNATSRIVNRNIINTNTSSINSNNAAIASNTANSSANATNITNTVNSLALASSNLSTLQSDLDDCMFTNQYCIPQNPNSDTTCTDCSQSASTNAFSATIIGNVTACRQGCNFSWNVINLDVISGCSTGVVAPGGTVASSCVVGVTGLAPQTIINGTAELVVSNSQYTSRIDTDSEAIAFSNTSALLPSVTTSCVNCVVTDSSGYFDATNVTGTISDCTGGCSYSWTITGSASPLAGSCLSGSVLSNQTATPTCAIEATVANDSSEGGSITLTAVSLLNISLTSSSIETYSLTNDLLSIALIDIVSTECLNGEVIFEGVAICSTTAQILYFRPSLNSEVYPTINGLRSSNWAASSCPDCVVSVRYIPATYSFFIDPILNGGAPWIENIGDDGYRVALLRGVGNIDMGGLPPFQGWVDTIVEFTITGQSQTVVITRRMRVEGLIPAF